ncbi:MAG: tRNA 2-thiouridine(34) synthase MnmA, partial [Nanoarchaeota archaeon]|nr:tRNA 2-thiouridine(34) synthase MnmA [Nanoarchaeota archaeon]
MKQKSVLLGISGGVDSSVAALLLQKKGYEVKAVFLKVFSDTKNPLTNECNWIEDYKSAQKICTLLEIPLIKLDYEEYYKEKVLEPMFKSYAKGLTPNPDISCNSIVKFPFLLKEAKKLKCDFIATGHYARIKKNKDSVSLLQGIDKEKDQSYFLAGLNQQTLKKTIFPIGNLTKSKVREIARKANLPNWNRESTEGICFVGKMNMQSFLKQKIKEKPGKIITEKEEVIGTHKGIPFYTIGQRITDSNTIQLEKGILSKTRLYVAKKQSNKLIVVPENHPLLKRKEVKINRLHLINPNNKIPSSLKARIRHLGEMHSGHLIKNKSHYFFKFNKPLTAIAPGQYIVFYKNQELIASGIM